jgi:hypothetical protein
MQRERLQLLLGVVLIVATMSLVTLLALSPAVVARPAGKESLPVTAIKTATELGLEDPPGTGLFKDVTKASGVKWAYRNGEEAGHLTMLESLGGGVGVFDFDGDGLLDIFVVGGGHFEKTDKQLGPRPPAPGMNRSCKILGYPCKLYRNLGNFRFQDVTDSILRFKGPWFYSHGCAVADYDCDGYPDLLVTGWGRVALFHNEKDPRDPTKRILRDVTREVGLDRGITWATSAAWADLDGDGYPDLYICQYVDWSFANHPESSFDGKTFDICPPKNFKGLQHLLFHNKGGKKFVEVSKEAGLKPGGADASKGLGVVIADFNRDGKPDIYVANDTVDNLLYFNVSKPGKIRLVECGLQSGTARDDRGSPNGSKGLDISSYDGSGLPHLFVTNYEGEKHGLYHNDWKPGTPIDKHFFSYKSSVSRISAIGQTFVGWGTGFVDLENGGWEDLFIVNGHAIHRPTGKGVSRLQRPLLLHNEGNGKFRDVSKLGGDYFEKTHLSRGLALGDLNNDGLVDAVISHMNANTTVLRNVNKAGNHWLGIELRGRQNRDVVGARLSLEVGGRTQWRFAKGGGSYASARDPRHVFGLGRADKVGRLTVVWPDGKEQHWDNLPIDRYHRLAQRP